MTCPAREILETLFNLKAEVNGIKKSMIPDTAKILSSDSEILSEVANDPNSIGVICLNQVNDSVKILAINEVDASTENVATEAYIASRIVQAVTSGNESASLQALKAWIDTEEGKKILTEMNITITNVH